MIVERERCNVHGEVETWCSAYAAGPWWNGDYWVRDMTVDRPHGRVVGVRDTLAAAIGMVDHVCWREYQIRNRDGEIVRGWWRAAVPAVQRGADGVPGLRQRSRLSRVLRARCSMSGEKVTGPMGYDRQPAMEPSGGGLGVQVQRKEVPMSEPRDGRPVLSAKGHGQGIMIQRDPEQRGPFATGKLSSPFPYYGGKSRWIDTVFARIGKVGVWSEPLCGTAVMTLNNPFPAPREVICELNAYIANFYRSLVADYPQTAWYADWPTNHHDLTARHRWLLAQGPELRERMVADPHDFDPKIAGWWVWGQSSWIGHGWCDGANTSRDRIPKVHHGQGVMQQSALTLAPVEDKRPKVPDGGGSGVSAQRDRVPWDQIPFVNHNGSGQGVQQQRDRVPHDKIPYLTDDPTRHGQGVQQQRVGDRIPHIGSGKFGNRGQGVQQQRAVVPREGMPQISSKPGGRGVTYQRFGTDRTGGGAHLVEGDAAVPRDGMPRVPTKSDGQGVAQQRATGPFDFETDGILDGSRLRPWFRAIAERLARVIILNRSWESALTDSVLQQTPSSPKPSVGVFLDPPYRTTRADGGKRSTGLYQGDTAAASDDVAAATYAWAVKHGERYRVAYCMHEGDFPIPPGWTAETMGFSGHRDAAKREKAVDQVIFSPACVPVPTDPQLGFGW